MLNDRWPAIMTPQQNTMIYFYQKQNWYSLLNDGKAPSVNTYKYMFWPKYKLIAILKHDYTNNRYSVN